MDEDQDQALNTSVEENNIPEAPTEETNLPEAETVEPEVATEGETEPEAESKKSASYRIRELNEEKKLAEEKARQLEEKAKSLEERMAELTGRVMPDASQQYTPPVFEQTVQEPLVKPGEEYIDPAELEKRIQARLDQNFQRTQSYLELQNARERNFERINTEAQKSVKSYPQLDPHHDNFDKELSNAVSEATEAYLKSNPTGSVTQFVNKLMKPYLRSIDKEVGNHREEVAKQASQSALRPTQVPRGEKPFEELSLKEMEERLGGVRR